MCRSSEPETILAELEPANRIISQGDKTLLGVLDDTTAAILQTLANDSGIRLQFLCRMNPSITSVPRKSRERTPSVKATLRATIYGEPALFEEVGSLLEESDIFLQDPIGCDRVVPYRNPHCLSSLDPKAEIIMTTVGEADPAIYTLQSPSCPIDFLSKFESDEALPDTEGPPSISTPLHKHQKQALTFMLRREEGWMLRGLIPDIWTIEHREYSRVA
jgi:SWI/SNF-related matrix-associated actin-dependent regulator of chromatin subfamily A3